MRGIITSMIGSSGCGKTTFLRATDEMFVTPRHRETADYIEGRYG